MNDEPEMRDLLERVGQLLTAALDQERCEAGLLGGIADQQKGSARNLLHYIALRSTDLRPLQLDLARRGLSSLGRTGASVLAGVSAVQRTLQLACGEPAAPVETFDPSGCLQEHTDSLLGRARQGRRTRIMVTAPAELAEDPSLAKRLVSAGMDILRINCAHDEPDVWRGMAKNTRKAAERAQLPCRILCDLAGPKLRTLAPGKDGRGHVRLSTGDRLYLVPPGASKSRKGVATMPSAVPEILRDLEPGQRIWFDDGKVGGVIVDCDPNAALIEITQAPQGGAKLKGDKGINLPDTRLSLPPLTDKDLVALDTVVEIADLVGQSFLRGPDDVRALTQELSRRRAEDLGVILKIETPTAFQKLPDVLLAGMERAVLGVMVAREKR